MYIVILANNSYLDESNVHYYLTEIILATVSRRLTDELVVYPYTGIRRTSCRRCSQRPTAGLIKA